MIMNATQRAALVFWGVLALLLLAPLSSYAAVTEEGAPNIMVRPFDGPKGKALQERVVKVLEEQGADLVPAGFEGPTALETDADYASVAARLNIRAYIQGEAANDNTGWKLKLTVSRVTGAMKGSYYDSTARKMRKLEGVLLQGEESGAGFFLGADVAGSWDLASPPSEQ